MPYPFEQYKKDHVRIELAALAGRIGVAAAMARSGMISALFARENPDETYPEFCRDLALSGIPE